MFELPEALDSILIDPTKLHFDPRSHPIGQGKNNKYSFTCIYGGRWIVLVSPKESCEHFVNTQSLQSLRIFSNNENKQEFAQFWYVCFV